MNSLEDVESSNNHPDMFLDRGLTPPTQIVKMLENSYCSDQLCGVTSMNNQMDPNGHFENFLAENQHFFHVIYQKMQNDLAIILIQV